MKNQLHSRGANGLNCYIITYFLTDSINVLQMLHGAAVKLPQTNSVSSDDQKVSRSLLRRDRKL